MAKPTQQNPLVLSNQAMLTLGLQKQPFTETILAAEAIFTDSVFDQFVETLKHHLQFSDLLLIVEGNLGSGKTTLYRRIIQDEIPNLYLLSVQAEATDTIIQLQQKISIHLKEQGDANYIDDNLKRLQVFDQQPVAIIDDAHVLSDITLQELLRYQKQLETEKEVNLKILLFANKGMAKTLEQITDLQHNQLYVQDMPALTSKQINAFIFHKLKYAGYNDVSFLSDEQLKSILYKSKGLPIEVMKQAVTEIEKWVKMQSKKQMKLSKPAIIALIMLAVIAGSGAIFFTMSSFIDDQLTDVSTSVPLPLKPQNTNIPAVMPPVTDKDIQAAADAEADTLGELQTQPSVEPEVIPEVAPSLIELQESEITTDTSTITAPVESIAAKPAAPASPVPAPIATKPAEPKAAPVATPAEKPKTIAATLITDPAWQPLIQLGIKGPAWLKTQDPNHWTLQILGARDPHSLVKFVTQNKLSLDDTAWYVTDLKGKPWYVLLHLFYVDQDIARKSIAHLPAELQQGSPWVKSIGAVQKAMKP